MKTENEKLLRKIEDLQSQLSNLESKISTPKDDNTKPLGKYHDLYLIFIGFILTAVIGGFLSHYFQKKMFAYQKQAIGYENSLKNKLDFYKTVSEIITERYLYSNRMIDQIEAKNENLPTTYLNYVKAIDTWSKNDAYNRTFLENNFYLDHNKIDTIPLHFYRLVAENFVTNLSPIIRNYKKISSGNNNLRDSCNLMLSRQDSLNRLFFIECSKRIFEKS